MQFNVRALNHEQQIQTLRLQAADETDARAQLKTRNLTALSLKQAVTFSQDSIGASRSKRFDLLLFAQELLSLIAAGLSVVEALDALLERSSQATTRLSLERLRDALQQGLRLSVALGQQPNHFPALFVGVVQAAEGTSDLPRALERYVDYETRLQTLRQKIVSAAIYPSILFAVGGAVALFLLGYVVPRFAAVYQSSNRPLPWASQMLLAWGQFASAYAVWLGIGLCLILVIAAWSARRLIRSGRWTSVLEWLPGARQRVEILTLTRLYMTMGMLLEGGIPIIRAMQLSEAVLTTGKAAHLQAARHLVGQGGSLSSALENQNLSTPVSLRLLRVGEQTGQLGLMLSRTAAFYDTETTRWIEQFSKAFEPLLMAAIGVVIGLIVVLLYMPIFDLAGSL